MADSSKSFWGKFKKTELKKTPFHSKLPTDLIEMFPTMDDAKLYNIYHLKCNDSITKTVEYLTKDQPSNYRDEVPIHVLIESLNASNIKPIHSSNHNHAEQNYFQLTPTHVLKHIFSFNGPMTLGKITRLNRECRLLSKSLLSKIRAYDFSYYYHHYCQYRLSNRYKNNKNKRNNHHRNHSNKGVRIIHNDELKLVSHINAFQYLESLSLRSTYFSKWHSFESILNKTNIKYLNLSSSLNLYDDDIAVIMEHFPGLQVLDLSNCIEITDLAMTHIIEYEHTNTLNTIYLNNTPQITKNGIKQLVNYKKSIINVEWKGAKYGNVSNVFEGAKHLKYLNLSSNNCLEQLVLTMDNKKSWLDLNLSNCTKLRFLDLNITHLRSINLTQCVRLREVRISHTFQLKEINCKSCKALQILAIPANTVEFVGLTGCNALNLELVFHENNFLIQSLIRGNLKSLDLAQVHHITDHHVEQLLNLNKSNGHSLKAFSVYECRLINNSTIHSIHRSFDKPRMSSSRIEKRKKRSDRKRRNYQC